MKIWKKIMGKKYEGEPFSVIYEEFKKIPIDELKELEEVYKQLETYKEEENNDKKD